MSKCVFRHVVGPVQKTMGETTILGSILRHAHVWSICSRKLQRISFLVRVCGTLLGVLKGNQKDVVAILEGPNPRNRPCFETNVNPGLINAWLINRGVCPF